jgi:DNA adenine methylase
MPWSPGLGGGMRPEFTWSSSQASEAQNPYTPGRKRNDSNEPLDTIARTSDAREMRYDGGKGACYRQLINLMPPHRRYIETHLGGGAVMRHKQSATQQVGTDLDPAVINLWRRRWPDICEIVHGDAIEVLRGLPLDADTVIYADPPYHPDSRRRSRVYRYDYTLADHEHLLECLAALPCKVMISGYASPLYAQRLAGWSLHQFQARTRVDTREECVWFNFPKPHILHDDRYLGGGFRERELIRRRQHRLRRRLEMLSCAEQISLHKWLGDRLYRKFTA